MSDHASPLTGFASTLSAEVQDGRDDRDRDEPVQPVRTRPVIGGTAAREAMRIGW